jgi:hypothetical protein
MIILRCMYEAFSSLESEDSNNKSGYSALSYRRRVIGRELSVHNSSHLIA